MGHLLLILFIWLISRYTFVICEWWTSLKAIGLFNNYLIKNANDLRELVINRFVPPPYYPFEKYFFKKYVNLDMNNLFYILFFKNFNSGIFTFLKKLITIDVHRWFDHKI